MIQDWIPSFLDEMSKVAAAVLNRKERRRQVLQYGALGLVAGPSIGALYNIISKGTPLPVGVKSPARWLAATTTAGLLTSGAIPAVQQHLSRNIQDQANMRVRSARARAERQALKGAP